MIGNNWDTILSDLFNSEEYNYFIKNLINDYKNFNVYPNFEDIFNCLKLCDYNNVKVVILGQDPYHQYGQANGLAFSVNKGVKIPPSLKNIFKEIYDDIGIKNTNTDLSNWAKQGVLLLNSVLTVKESMPKYYSNSYWKKFTDQIINRVSKKKNIIFILWGNDAICKSKIIENGNYILTSSHPSPLSSYRGFFGCKHFSTTNKILNEISKNIIDWRT